LITVELEAGSEHTARKQALMVLCLVPVSGWMRR